MKLADMDEKFETGETSEVFSRPSDFLKMELFADKHLGQYPDEVKNVYSNYATYYFALKRTGKLSEHGIEDGELTPDVLDAMVERLSIQLYSLKDSDLAPLAAKQ